MRGTNVRWTSKSCEGGELGAAPRWSNGEGVGGEAELCCRVLGLQLEKQEAKVLGDLEVVPGDKRRVWVRVFFLSGSAEEVFAPALCSASIRYRTIALWVCNNGCCSHPHLFFFSFFLNTSPFPPPPPK